MGDLCWQPAWMKRQMAPTWTKPAVSRQRESALAVEENRDMSESARAAGPGQRGQSTQQLQVRGMVCDGQRRGRTPDGAVKRRSHLIQQRARSW